MPSNDSKFPAPGPPQRHDNDSDIYRSFTSAPQRPKAVTVGPYDRGQGDTSSGNANSSSAVVRVVQGAVSKARALSTSMNFNDNPRPSSRNTKYLTINSLKTSRMIPIINKSNSLKSDSSTNDITATSSLDNSSTVNPTESDTVSDINLKNNSKSVPGSGINLKSVTVNSNTDIGNQTPNDINDLESVLSDDLNPNLNRLRNLNFGNTTLSPDKDLNSFGSNAAPGEGDVPAADAPGDHDLPAARGPRRVRQGLSDDRIPKPPFSRSQLENYSMADLRKILDSNGGNRKGTKSKNDIIEKLLTLNPPTANAIVNANQNDAANGSDNNNRNSNIKNQNQIYDYVKFIAEEQGYLQLEKIGTGFRGKSTSVLKDDINSNLNSKDANSNVQNLIQSQSTPKSSNRQSFDFLRTPLTPGACSSTGISVGFDFNSSSSLTNPGRQNYREPDSDCPWYCRRRPDNINITFIADCKKLEPAWGGAL